MGEILNVGLGTVHGKDEIKIYSLSKPAGIDDIEVFDGKSEKKDKKISIQNFDVDDSIFSPYNEQALISEESFFIDLQDDNTSGIFKHIKHPLLKNDLLFNAPQIGVDSGNLKKLDDKKERIRFFIFEREGEYLLCEINQYTHILKRKKGISLGESPTEFNIHYGVVYPEKVSAILEKKSRKLSVINVLDFERMFQLKAVRHAKAEKVLEGFKSKKNTIGKDGITVEFGDEVDLKDNKYNKTRQISYLAGFDPEKTKYSTKKIKKAISLLPAEAQVEIVDNNLKINNELQFRTFVAILHDTIIHRLLSDSVQAF